MFTAHFQIFNFSFATLDNAPGVMSTQLRGDIGLQTSAFQKTHWKRTAYSKESSILWVFQSYEHVGTQ